MNPELKQEAITHWKLFRSGDRDSFAWIYKNHVIDLYNYGSHFTENPDIVEDAIQDVFIRIWETKERLKIPPSVRNYLFTALRHNIFRKLSQNKKIENTDNCEDPHIFNLEPSYENVFIELEENTINAKNLKEAISRLTNRQKEVIFLRYYQGVSYEDIATIMNITTKATYKLVARGISALRKNFLKINIVASTLIFQMVYKTVLI